MVASDHLRRPFVEPPRATRRPGTLLDYQAFSLRVSEADLHAGRLEQILRAVPPERVLAMQLALREVAPRFEWTAFHGWPWSKPEGYQDAADTLFAALAARVVQEGAELEATAGHAGWVGGLADWLDPLQWSGTRL